MLPGVNDLLPDHLFDAAQSHENTTSTSPPRSVPSPAFSTSPVRSRTSHQRRRSSASHPYPPPPHHPQPSAPLQRSSAHYTSYPPYSTPHPTEIQLQSGTSPHAVALVERRNATNVDVERMEVGEMARDEDESDGVTKDGKRHTCMHCGKRFNRPSSLKIHVNTHTGAKPFECPHPGCGRQFNVSSNMRRHFRNHTSSGPSSDPDADQSYTASPPVTLSRSLPSTGVSPPTHVTGLQTHPRIYPHGHGPSSYPTSFSSASSAPLDSDDDEHDTDDGESAHSPGFSVRSVEHERRRRGSLPFYAQYSNTRTVPTSPQAHQHQQQQQMRYAYTQPMYTFPPPPPPPSLPMPLPRSTSQGLVHAARW